MDIAQEHDAAKHQSAQAKAAARQTRRSRGGAAAFVPNGAGPENPGPSQSPLTIHMITTTPEIGKVIANELLRAGHKVCTWQSWEDVVFKRLEFGLLFVEDRDDAIAQLVSRMTSVWTWLPIVAFSAATGRSRPVNACNLGAVDYVDLGKGRLQRYLTAMQFGTRLARLGGGYPCNRFELDSWRHIHALTRREMQTLAGIATGCSSREIGERYAISQRTVDIHRSNLVRKLAARGTADAVRIAMEMRVPLTEMACQVFAEQELRCAEKPDLLRGHEQRMLSAGF